MNLIILGPPGSGKGTQAQLLADSLGLFYFESGEFSRNLAKKNPRIREIVNRGDLIPEEEMTNHVSEYLNAKALERQNILFDGYPRFISQYKFLKKWLAEKGQKVDAVIFLEVSDEEIIRRLSARRYDKATGKIYNLITQPPPKEERVNLFQREDDKPKVIKERIRVFKQNTLAIIDEAQKDGILMKIDGEETIEAVFKAIMARLKQKQ